MQVVHDELVEDHDVLYGGDFQGFKPYSDEPTVPRLPRQSADESIFYLDSWNDKEVKEVQEKEGKLGWCACGNCVEMKRFAEKKSAAGCQYFKMR